MTSVEKSPLAGPSNGRWAMGTIALLVLVSGFYFASRSGTDSSRYSNDFNVYYFASNELIEGRDPYERSLGESTRYLYLPLLAELMVPLGLLPLAAAAYIWFLISAASLAAAAWMSAQMGAGEPGNGSLAEWEKETVGSRIIISILAVSVVLRFVLDNFDLGQVNPVVAMLAVASIFLYDRSPKLSSVVALVLAVSIKLTPAVLIFYHLAKRRLKYAVLCLALFGSVTALSFVPFGSDSTRAFQTFVSRTLRNEQGFDLSYSGNQSLRGAIARLRGETPESAHNPSDTLTIMLSLMMLALSGAATIASRNKIGGLASLFCCVALLSPLAWKAHFILFIFPAAFLISQIHLRWRSKRAYAALALLAASFCLFNLTSPKVLGAALAEWADSHSLVFAGGVLIYAATLLWAFDRKAMTSQLGFVTLLKRAE